MNIECLYANGDIVEVMSTPMPAAVPPEGYAYSVETLHIADAASEGIVLRRRAITYTEREARPLVRDLDNEECVVVAAREVPHLLQMDVNGRTRLARIMRDEEGNTVLDPDGPLVAMQLSGENMLDAGPSRDEAATAEEDVYFGLSELLGDV